MKVRVLRVVLLFPLFCCLMGAISWSPPHPVPNPGGALVTIEGKGIYRVPVPEKFSGVYMYRRVNGAPVGTEIVVQANAANNKWDKTITVAAPGNYIVWGELVTVGPGVKVKLYETVRVVLPVK